MNARKDAVNPSAAQMERARVARYDQLDILESQKNHDIPQQVADLIWSRKLLPAICLENPEPNPFGVKSPIHGAGGMTMLFAVCPPGTGPTLHKHHRTYETFTVMKGRFEFRFGDAGSEKLVLNRCDVFSLPPGVHRGFRNISDEEGILQVIVTGGTHDRTDISFPPATAHEISAAGEQYLDYFKKLGLVFE